MKERCSRTARQLLVTGLSVCAQRSWFSAAGRMRETVQTSGISKGRWFGATLVAVLSFASVTTEAKDSVRVFPVENFGASHSAATIKCSGTAGTRLLRCDGAGDLQIGEGLMISSAGPPPAVAEIGERPALNPSVKRGAHTYSYVVVAADLFHGMARSSPVSTVDHSMPLDGSSRVNLVTTPAKGPLPIYLWYASEDNGPYKFVLADEHTTPGSPDAGQRPADGRGWPSQLPALPKNEDLWTTVTAVDGNQISVADTLAQTVRRTTVYHDDTLATQRAVDAAVVAGGGIVRFGPFSYNLWRPAFWHGKSWSRSISGAVPLYPPKIYVQGTGNIVFEGAGPQTKLLNLPDASTFSSLVSFGSERRRPWELPYSAIRPVRRATTEVVLAAASGSSRFHAGDDVWLFSGSFQHSPCPPAHGTPGGNCHYSELNTIDRVDSTAGALHLRFPATNWYHDDGINPLGIVNVAGYSMHDVGFRNLSIDAYGPISTEALIRDFRFDHVQVPIGPATNWWYGGLNRGWTVTDSTLNIGAGGMSYSVMNEMDQYADVKFVNDTFIGHSAPREADRMLADASIKLDEGSGDLVFDDDRFIGVQIQIDNAFNGVTVRGCRFENAGLHLGCDVRDGCGALIASFGVSEDVSIESNRFQVRPPYSPTRLFEIRIPAQDVRIVKNTIDSKCNGSAAIPLMYLASGDIRENTIMSDCGSAASGIEIVPSIVPGLPQPDIIVVANHIVHEKGGIGIEVKDPGRAYMGQITISDNLVQGDPTTQYHIDSNAAKNVRIRRN